MSVNIKHLMVYEAINNYENVRPCEGRKSLMDCFEYSRESQEWLLYFNYDKLDVKGDTGIIRESKLSKEIADFVIEYDGLKSMEHTLKDTTIVSY